ncbi:MAG: phage tail sheath family protein [Gammaproteobacteria bacterium]|nr:phage tail sheath family protein [Gammaproteobacteria bacterium]
MPIAISYPGGYIEEIPSGGRAIVGVATSITAFIGRALRGPVDEPITINSYGDYERIFGGLWLKSPMSFAVRDFYLNGGSQAIIVRLFQDVLPQIAEINANGLTLEAAYPGTWGNYLRARIDYDVSEDKAADFGLQETDLFNLTIRDTKTGETEQFRNVTILESPQQINKVLENRSNLMRVYKSEFPPDLPFPNKTNRPDKHDDPASGNDTWENNTLSSPVDHEASDGEILTKDAFINDKEKNKEGLYALEKADLFNLLCIPPHELEGDIELKGDIESDLIGVAAKYCEDRRAMFIVDSPANWSNKKMARDEIINIGTKSKNAAVFFPRLRQPNPKRSNQIEDFVSCGAVAGVFSRTDVQRGVWKAPAGLEASLVGVPQLSVPLTDMENGELNPLGINCMRSMPAIGPVVWGSRTLQGNDRLASEWKYIPIRRLALYIEESLYRGTQWVVFEPNDEPLWAQIRLNVGAFMHNLFRQGAFQGSTPREAYFVKCDKETTTQNDRNLGIVNIVVGFAPLKPAEFVIIKIQQIAGDIQT